MKMTEEELKNDGYMFHHYACRNGYTRKADIGTVRRYHGRYGKGYIMMMGQFVCACGKRSTRYKNIAYYIKKED